MSDELGLEVLNRGAIDFDDAAAALGVCNGNSSFLHVSNRGVMQRNVSAALSGTRILTLRDGAERSLYDDAAVDILAWIDVLLLHFVN